MILQRLVEHYERKRSAKDPIPPFGFSRERIGFELVIDPNDDSAELNDLRSTPILFGKKGKKESEALWMTVPYRGDRSSNIKPNFLWDNTGYVLGRTKKPVPETKKLKSFLGLHHRMLAIAPDDGLASVVRFLEKWDPVAYDNFKFAGEALEQNVVFRMKGKANFVHESGPLQAAWPAFFRSDVEQRQGFDLLTGDVAAIAATHFLLSGVAGAQATGASLSSFNDTAYLSYGLKSSLNSPVSVDNAFRYAASVKELLSFERRKISLGDATVTFWAEKQTPLEEYSSEIWGEAPPPAESAPEEDKLRFQQVRLFLSQVREGRASKVAVDPDSATRFYVLGLSPNAARISIRFWVDTTVADMKSTLAQHMSDIEMTGAREDDPPLMMRRIVACTGRAVSERGRFKNYDTDSVSPLLAGAVARAVLTGGPYPQALLATLVNRIKADGAIRHERVAAIKAVLVRNKSKEVPVALDLERTEPAYVTGRLFALLEKIQSDSAGGEMNATIKDRYFSAASATPGLVFPRLIRLCQHHLAKMETGQKIYYERMLGEVVGKLQSFASHLMLEGQGLFAIGYFHQRQGLFTSKKKEAEAA